MANAFDQFDVKEKAGNPFDQFDVAQKEAAARKERTMLEAGKDILAGGVSGAGALVQLPGQLYGLATGDFSDTGLTKVGREMRETGESMKSEELKRREVERSSKIAAAEKEGQVSAGVTAFMETIKDPSLLTNFIAEQAPNLIPGFGVARGLKAAGMGAQAVRGAIGTGAVQQGADIGAQSYEELYKELKSKGMSDGEAAGRALGYARATGAGAAVISVLAQRLPGAKAIEEAMAGVEGKAATGILGKAGRLGRAATGAAGEAASEITEETGGKLLQNVAMAQERPDFDLTTGLGQTAGMAAVGGVGMGGVSGALSRAPSETIPPEKPPEAPPEKPPGVETPPGSIPTPKLNRASEEEIKKLDTYYEGKPEDFGLSLADIQNRDRSKPASIAQMQSIAANPNYDRISVSREFASGAPVVISDIQLPDTQLGRIETVASEDNTRFPIRYAVVDAGQLTPSHLVDGTSVQDYGNPNVEGIRPVAGNGRVAGLMQAYKQGTAEDYKAKMMEDTDHGINPEVIQQIQNPVLIRIMPKSELTPDIADKSNVAGQMRMTPAEQAKVDLGRFDVTKVDFMADGAPSYESLVQFINSMPESERAELMDEGAPSKEAVTRINNAIFSHAYDSPQLMRLFSQAIDPEAATVMRAIALAAPSMHKLNEAGEYDFRDRLINAAQEIVNARRRGISLATFRQQQDIDRDPYTAKIMDFFIDNLRAPRRMGEALMELADAAHAQSVTGEDMFGEVPKIPMQDIFNRVFGGEPITQPFTQKPETIEVPKVEEPEVKERIPFEIDKSVHQIAQEIYGMSIPQLSQWMIDNAPNSAAKAIAEAIHNRITEYDSIGVSMTLEILQGKKRDKTALGSASFIPTKQRTSFVVRLNAPPNANNTDIATGTEYETIIHELLHVVTQAQIGLLPKTDPRIQELENLLDIVNRQIEKDMASGKNNDQLHPMILVFLNEKRHGPKKWKTWGPRRNISELIAWGLTDPEYQSYLSTIKVGDKTAFSKFVDALRKLLGLKEQYQTALEKVAYITEQLVTENIGETEKLIESIGGKFGLLSPSQAFTSKSEVGSDSEISKFLEEKWQRLVDGPPKTKPKGFDHVPDKFWDGINPIFYPQGKTIFKKIDDMRPTFWKRLAQGIADQYRSIKDYSEEAYMLARMSKTVDGALEGLMFFGQVFLDNGALNIKPNSKGLLDVFKPLGEEVDSFMIWQAMNRDAELAANKRAPSIAQGLVAQRKLLSDGTMPNGKNRLEEYEKVQKELNLLNRSVLRIAYKQGLIDKKAFAIFSRDINYIPFYKVMEENGDVQAAATKSGLVNQYMSKALKGGEKPFGDLMENTLRNWSHILSASQKNAAAGATMKAAVEQGGAYPNLKSDLGWQDGKVYATRRMGLVDRINDNDELSESQKRAKIDRLMKPYVEAINQRTDISDSQKQNLIEGIYEGLANGDGKLIPEMTTSEGKGISKIMIGGQPTYFKVEDQLLMEAIASIGYMGPKSKFLDVARDFKNMLQFGVTISPAFKVRNLFRDSIAAMAVSDLKKQPWANVVKGWAESDRNNPAHISALAGGAIFNFGSAYEGDQAKMIRRLIKMGVKEGDILDTPEKIKAGLAKMWDAYQEFGNKSESANRMALYTQLREKDMNHLQASFYARDMLDFSMQGAWPAVRMVTQVVPFLNARVQGLYKLGRDGLNPTVRVIYNSVTGKPLELTDKQKAQQFSTVMTAVALASLMLYMAFKDDEEFKKREEWDRDNFWWFKLPGMETAIRIPKPFEIGAFGTMAERTAEQIMDKSAEGKTFEKSLKRMLSDTFALNPVPQMVRPLVDLYSNKDSFTGAPIETAGMERLSKEQRIAEKTSPLAIALSKVTNVFLPESAEVSPVQTDYAIKSYFGWLGGTASATSHYAVMPFSKSAYPDQNWAETMSLGFIKSLPTAQSKYVTAFYENNKEISQAYADMRHYAEIGETEKAYKIIEEKGDLIAMAKVYDKVSKDMSKIRQAIMAIRADEDMTGAQKKEEIDRLKIIIGELAEQAEGARKSLSQR